MTATPSYTLIENLVEAVQEIPVDSIVSRTVIGMIPSKAF